MSMIDRVGNGLSEALASLGSADVDAGVAYLIGVAGVDVYGILAKAALTAMREPTPDMIEAGLRHEPHP